MPPFWATLPQPPFPHLLVSNIPPMEKPFLYETPLHIAYAEESWLKEMAVTHLFAASTALTKLNCKICHTHWFIIEHKAIHYMTDSYWYPSRHIHSHPLLMSVLDFPTLSAHLGSQSNTLSLAVHLVISSIVYDITDLLDIFCPNYFLGCSTYALLFWR